MRKIFPIIISLMALLAMASCLPGPGQQGGGQLEPGKPVVELITPGQDHVPDCQETDIQGSQEANSSDCQETDYQGSQKTNSSDCQETDYQGSQKTNSSDCQEEVHGIKVKEKGHYTDKEHVALYIHTYGHLPCNYITKREAQSLGWESQKGNLKKVAPGKSIGGDKFGNYEGQLPKAKGRKYFECDIGYSGGKRNAKRIIFSSDGLVFYTGDHYKTFQQLY